MTQQEQDQIVTWLAQLESTMLKAAQSASNLRTYIEQINPNKSVWTKPR
jgi:hypothetical protein